MQICSMLRKSWHHAKRRNIVKGTADPTYPHTTSIEIGPYCMELGIGHHIPATVPSTYMFDCELSGPLVITAALQSTKPTLVRDLYGHYAPNQLALDLITKNIPFDHHE